MSTSHWRLPWSLCTPSCFLLLLLQPLPSLLTSFDPSTHSRPILAPLHPSSRPWRTQLVLQEEDLPALSCAVWSKFPPAAGSLVPQVAVCCKTQISLALWPLSHHFTEKNSVHCVELQFTQNPWHRLSSHLAIARTVTRNQHLRQNAVSVLLCSPFNPMARNQGPPLKIG